MPRVQNAITFVPQAASYDVRTAPRVHWRSWAAGSHVRILFGSVKAFPCCPMTTEARSSVQRILPLMNRRRRKHEEDGQGKRKRTVRKGKWARTNKQRKGERTGRRPGTERVWERKDAWRWTLWWMGLGVDLETAARMEPRWSSL
jgi:hypothetical protein